MDRLRCIQIFVEVARSCSFTAAAHRLKISRASATKHVSSLEGFLGAKLLVRSSQNVRLTEAGRTLLRRGENLIRDLEEIEADIKFELKNPAGLIRIGVPSDFESFQLMPALASFQTAYPDISILLHNECGQSRLIEERLDFSIRIASSFKDSNHISRLLLREPQLLVAAPSYIAKHGLPKHPNDLSHHNCLINLLCPSEDVWSFQSGEEIAKIKVKGSVKSDLGEALRSATLLGLGISMHPAFILKDEIKRGRLQVLMSDWKPPTMEVRAVFPQKDHVPARFRIFIEYLVAWFSSCSDQVSMSPESALRPPHDSEARIKSRHGEREASWDRAR